MQRFAADDDEYVRSADKQLAHKARQHRPRTAARVEDEVATLDEALLGEFGQYLAPGCLQRSFHRGEVREAIDPARRLGGGADKISRPRQQQGRQQQPTDRRPDHSITSSALASRPGGTVNPSSRAARRLTINSNTEGCSTGKSPGTAPSRMRTT